MKPKLVSDAFVERWNLERERRRGAKHHWLSKRQIMSLLGILTRRQQQMVIHQFDRGIA